MNLAVIGSIAGIASAIIVAAGVLWTIYKSVKAGVAEDAAALDTKYADGIAEGLRRAQYVIDLRTSERDQARLDLANRMMAGNQQQPRRGGQQ